MPGSALDVPGALIDAERRLSAPVAEPVSPPASGATAGRVVTALLVFGPLLALAMVPILGWGQPDPSR